MTRQDIYPNTFEETQVKYAAQIFSRTVAAAVKTIYEITKLKNSSAELTLSIAHFVEKIDKKKTP